MGFWDSYSKLKDSKEFKEWIKENKDCYISYAMIVDDTNVWKIGFYDPKSDKITSFDVTEPVLMEPAEKIFKRPEDKVKEINLDDVKVKYEEAVDAAKKIREKKYSAHVAMKTITILQNLDVGQVWNITIVTQSFNTLNIKIDTKTKEVLEEKLTPLIEQMDIQKGEGGKNGKDQS